MAIEIELPDGTIAEFPDGMSNEEIEAVLSQQFGAPAPASPPTAEPQGFLAKADAALGSTGLGRTAAEFASAVNRGAVDLAEFLTTDQIQGIQELIGSESRVPNLRELLPQSVQEGLGGNFMGEGVARDAVRAAGEVIPAAVGTAGLLRGAANALPAATAGEGVLPGALRVLGSEGTGSAAATGATSAAGGAAGGSIGEAVGGETGRQIGQLAGSIAAPLAGGAIAARVAPNAPVTPPRSTVGSVSDTVKLAGDDSKIAKYVMDGTGKIKSDPVARAAIKQGIDEGLVATIKGASPKDREAMRQMLQLAKQGKSTRRFAVENRPGDIVGQSVTNRFRAIKTINQEAGKELETIVRGLKTSGETVDATGAVGKFLDDLESMGVQFDIDGNPNFKGSDIEGLDGPEKFLKRMLARARTLGDGEVDVYDAHRLKKFIDEQVVYGTNTEGLAGKAENAVKALRRNINATLGEKYPEYAAANKKFSDTIEQLEDFSRVAGKNFNPLSENADKQAGVLSRRLLSNVTSRAALMDSLGGLQRTAAKYGTEFGDDVMTQAMFASDLEKIFGPSAQTSLASEIGKGALDVGVGVATGTQGPASAGASVLRSAVRGAQRINQDNAIKALDNLLAPKPVK